MEAKYFRCRNWHKFQHYPEGSRRLSWIKNWISLDDPSDPFSKLTFAEQGRLQAIWRLAAKLENKIPYDEVFVGRAIGAKRVPLGDLLESGWIQVGTETELKKLANAEKRAANRRKRASRPVANNERNAASEAEAEKEEDKDKASAVPAGEFVNERVLKLLRVCRDADEGTPAVLRRLIENAPEGDVAWAIECASGPGVRSPTAVAVAELQKRANGRAA